MDSNKIYNPSHDSHGNRLPERSGCPSSYVISSSILLQTDGHSWFIIHNNILVTDCAKDFYKPRIN